MKSLLKVGVTVALLSGITLTASASEDVLASKLNDSKGYYIGIQNGSLSAKMDVTDKVKAQVIIGFLGDLTSVVGRGLYEFKEYKDVDFYAYGSLGMLTWDGSYWNGYRYTNDTESVMTYGIGVGAEYDIRALDPGYIPLYLTADIGFGGANFKYYNDYNSMVASIGIHYKIEK